MDCPICWSDLTEDPTTGTASSGSGPPTTKKSKLNNSKIPSTEICILPCGHLYHKHCLTQWFAQQSNGKSGTCPHCRKHVKEKEFYPVYFTSAKNSGTETKGTQPTAPDYSLFGAFPSSSTEKSSNPDKSSDASSKKPTSPQISCTNESCRDLQMRFNTLESDNAELLKKLTEERERADLNQAIIDSLKHVPANAKEDKEPSQNTNGDAGNNIDVIVISDDDEEDFDSFDSDSDDDDDDY